MQIPENGMQKILMFIGILQFLQGASDARKEGIIIGYFRLFGFYDIRCPAFAPWERIEHEGQ